AIEQEENPDHVVSTPRELVWLEVASFWAPPSGNRPPWATSPLGRDAPRATAIADDPDLDLDLRLSQHSYLRDSGAAHGPGDDAAAQHLEHPDRRLCDLPGRRQPRRESRGPGQRDGVAPGGAGRRHACDHGVL